MGKIVKNGIDYSSGGGASTLTGLTDTTISSPSNGQVLAYDSTTSKWKNSNASGGASTLNELTDVTITSATSGQVLKNDGTKWVNGTVPSDTTKQPKTLDTPLTIDGSSVTTVEGGLSSIGNTKQPKTLSTPITIGGTSRTSVEAALNALNANEQQRTLDTPIVINNVSCTTVEQALTRLTMNSHPYIDGYEYSTSGTVVSDFEYNVKRWYYNSGTLRFDDVIIAYRCTGTRFSQNAPADEATKAFTGKYYIYCHATADSNIYNNVAESGITVLMYCFKQYTENGKNKCKVYTKEINSSNGEGWTENQWYESGTSLDELPDVSITSAKKGNALVYDGTSWVNGYANPLEQYTQSSGNADFESLTQGIIETHYRNRGYEGIVTLRWHYTGNISSVTFSGFPEKSSEWYTFIYDMSWEDTDNLKGSVVCYVGSHAYSNYIAFYDPLNDVRSINAWSRLDNTSENAYTPDDTAETALADADYVPFYDTSATAKKKTLWSNVKSVLKTYFDTVYSGIFTNATELAKIGEQNGVPTYDGQIMSLPNTSNFDKNMIIDSTEKVVGKWTSGKPLYSKVITFSETTATASNWSPVISNALSGLSVDIIPITYIGAKDGVGWYPTASGKDGTNGFTFYNPRPTTLTCTSAIIYYTKTTDAANSFNYASENDYSTSETIVGKWIDGKTLYQRTYTGTTSTSNTPVSIGSITATYKIKKISGVIDLKNNMYAGLTYAEFTTPNNVKGCMLYVDNGSIKVWGMDTLYQAKSVVATIQYTKS